MIKKYFSHIADEILPVSLGFVTYFITSIFYIIKVNEFNAKYSNEKNPLTVMSVENGIAWKYFVLALVFIVLGVALIVFCYKKMNIDKFDVFFTLIVFIIIVIILMIMVILVINNPIFQCALAVMGLATLGMLAFSQ